MTENPPDVSELRQWTLLKQLHESGAKLGTFLKENHYPYNATLKPWGKYYAHIRNKNLRVMAISMEHRINFIDNEISKITDEPLLKDIKQLPSVSRTNLINILAVANSDEKRKILSVLRDLTVDEQIEVIVLLNSL
jgi:hypothetical protein